MPPAAPARRAVFATRALGKACRGEVAVPKLFGLPLRKLQSAIAPHHARGIFSFAPVNPESMAAKRARR
jgi:hypothetical protein